MKRNLNQKYIFITHLLIVLNIFTVLILIFIVPHDSIKNIRIKPIYIKLVSNNVTIVQEPNCSNNYEASLKNYYYNNGNGVWAKWEDNWSDEK
jgi:hypothetical protein